MMFSSQEHGYALKQIENLLPSIEELTGDIEVLLPLLPNDPIEDLFIFNQIKAQFDKKDNLASQLEQKISEISHLEKTVKDEVRRCQDNLGVLRRGSMSVDGQEAQSNLRGAKDLQQDQLTNVEEIAQQMHSVMSKADGVINSARARQCPPFFPKPEPQPDMLISSPFAKPLSTPYPSGFFHNGLLELGPMNGGFDGTKF